MKKLNVLKKIFLYSSPLLVSAPISVLAAKCKKADNGENAGYQTKIIKGQLTKNAVMSDLVGSSLAKFYAEDIKNHLTPAQQKMNLYDKLNELIFNKASEFSKLFYELFNIYAHQKLDADGQYFTNLKSLFSKANIDTTSFTPTTYNMPTDEQLKFIMKHSKFINDDIRLEILKQMIIRNYLIKERKELRDIANKDGEDKLKKAKKIDKKTPVAEKELHEALNFKDNSLYLYEALMNYPLMASWEFTDKREMNLRKSSGSINNIDGFNRLATWQPNSDPAYEYNEPAKEWIINSLLVKSGDSNVDVTKIAAFKGIKKISSTSGDLSYSLSALKEQKSPIYGLMDPNNSKIYSSDSFTFAKLIKHIKKAPLASLTDEKKAEIAAGKNKTIEEKDINLKNHTSGLGEITKKVDGKKTTFSAKYELNGKTYNVEYTIESITYDLEKSNNVNVKFKMTVKELAARHYTEFRSLIQKEKDWAETEDGKDFNLGQFPESIDIYNKSSKQFDGKYVIKIAPAYNKDTKKLTFKGTPWSSLEEQRKIANNLVTLNGVDLFKKAMKYFKELNVFKINEKNLHTEVKDMLKQIGIL